MLSMALRNKASQLRLVEVATEAQHQTLCDAAELLRVMARLMDGQPAIKAFGAVGDWGYETELGQALVQLRQGTCAGVPAWVLVIKVLLDEISAGRFNYPHKIESGTDGELLCVRTRHITEYLAGAAHLVEFRSTVPVMSDRVLKKQILRAGALLTTQSGSAAPIERTLNGRRVGHMAGIRLAVCREVADRSGHPLTAPFKA